MSFEKAKELKANSKEGHCIFKTKFWSYIDGEKEKYKIEIFAHMYTLGQKTSVYYRFVLKYKYCGIWYPACNEVIIDIPERVALQYLWTIQNYMLSQDVGDGPENEAWRPNA